MLAEVNVQLHGQDVSLQVHAGDRIRLVGPNGSGKTTILRALAGLPVSAPAQAIVHGDDPAMMDAAKLATLVAYVPHVASDALVGLTVAGEARLRNQSLAGDQDIATLSTGEARKLALHFANAPVLLLDEPNEGLDRAAIEHLRERISNHPGAVVFADHGPLADLATATISLGDNESTPVPATPLGTDPVLDVAAFERHGINFDSQSLPLGVHAVTGANGCGKSTWLRAISGLDGPLAKLRGTPVRPGREASMLLAQSRDHLHEPIAEGPWTPGLEGRHPWTLSAGETQRAALDMVLASDAHVLLLDEPEAHLDAAGREMLATELQRLGQTKCIILATHDPDFIRACNEVPL